MAAKGFFVGLVAGALVVSCELISGVNDLSSRGGSDASVSRGTGGLGGSGGDGSGFGGFSSAGAGGVSTPANPPRRDAGPTDASLPVGDASTIPPLHCTDGGTACGGRCVDLATDDRNCGGCGHDCGALAKCSKGVCPSIVLEGTQGTVAFAVDDDGVYFSDPTEVHSCPPEGCRLAPRLVLNHSTTQLVAVGGNVALQVSIPTTAPPYLPSRSFVLCPTSGCVNNGTFLASVGKYGTLYGLGSSANDVYYSWIDPIDKPHLARCVAPRGGQCTSTVAEVSPVTPDVISATDTTVFFDWVLSDGGGPQLVVVPSSGPSQSPHGFAPSPNAFFAFGGGVYMLATPLGPVGSITYCPSTGCPLSGPTLVVSTSYQATELSADATSIYWISGTEIDACPLTGCVGGPARLSDPGDGPTLLHLSSGFVYWLNGSGSTATIKRVAKPRF